MPLSGTGTSLYVGRYFPRDFFAVTTNWIYFIDIRDGETNAQRYRTDGCPAQKVSNFWDRWVFYDGSNASLDFFMSYTGDQVDIAEDEAIFLHHVLETAPHRVYFLAATPNSISPVPAGIRVW